MGHARCDWNRKSVQEVSKQIRAAWNLTLDLLGSRQSDSNRRPADYKFLVDVNDLFCIDRKCSNDYC